jgi:threonine dehydrogenase-like Zn-dependent dehydrogenase
VFGLGAVGNLAAQGFAARGCKVIGIDPVPFRRTLAQRCGIATTIGGDAEEVRKQIREITGGGPQIAIDAVGHTAVVREAVAVAAPFAQIVLLGSPRVPVEGNNTPLLSQVHVKFLVVRGALEWCLTQYPEFGADRLSQYEKQVMIFDWLRAGKLKLAELVSHRLPPEMISEAYHGLEDAPQTFTGVALNWTGKG